MEICLKKGFNRNVLTCRREDGTSTHQNLGPSFPYHDIAHYVVEKKLNLENGFYGQIRSGMSIAELSDKNVIKHLASEAWLAEILTRNLQALSSHAATLEQYSELILLEAKNMSINKVPQMDLKVIVEMRNEYATLCNKWDALSENETLKLIF